MAVHFIKDVVQRKGITPEEVAECYTKKAESTDYDKMIEGLCRGPQIMADEMTSLFPTNRGTLSIMDIACGTGRLGTMLAEVGFKYIDGLDPSAGMLKVCREKNVYTKLFEDFCNDKRLPIKDDVYDCVTLTGGMAEGGVPSVALYEMVRMVKPGGLILILMNKTFLESVDDIRECLEPTLEKLQDENLVENVERRAFDNYFVAGEEGLLLKLKVKTNTT